ncbi:5'/3'-nucleotidase SurE [Haloarchaeobius iranensis]|uniref:5'-nucleotidase SurE n=1 Tax=Haloarchaeobius iranensis TaxID=996166 RepID=A0A1G9WLJ6_9EURY|nr:5'/3'-nucleotidase SurE [Haloarchaeobius iranensis]SDM85472.1 5'-nucleotidase /3'-nucleotidase /exopolyphosphatase [Haloarchaeobius iranensis]
MDDDLDILLTNDDGIESPGFKTLYDSLSELGDVTAVAPATDQSAVGRAISSTVDIAEHELGYAIEGTPADCVVAGLQSICPDPDLVVSGCNKGANLGHYVLGRSGTVSAAVEAAFFGVPAIAASLYVPIDPDEDREWTDVDVPESKYDEATRATTYLVEHALGAGVFDNADYLNLNAPVPDYCTGDIEITRPSHMYDMDATVDNGIASLHDRVWERMAAGEIPDPEGTDRRAVVDGHISVSPLTAPHTTEHHDALDALAETYGSD